MREDAKFCGGCGAWLARSAFARNHATKDGLQTRCKACSARWARDHRPRRLDPAPQVEAGQKWCRRCKTIKSVSHFGPHASTKDGRQTYCRGCFAAIYRERRQREGHVVRPADIPVGHKFCRGCQRVLPFEDWAARSTNDGLAFQCKTCMSAKERAKHLARSYGMSLAELDDMLAAQHGVCAICQTAPAIHVDHDHRTGQIRGLLCFRCNAALGQLADDPLVLRRAARYLERSRSSARADFHRCWHAHVEPSVLERRLRAQLSGTDLGTAS